MESDYISGTAGQGYSGTIPAQDKVNVQTLRHKLTAVKEQAHAALAQCEELERRFKDKLDRPLYETSQLLQPVNCPWR